MKRLRAVCIGFALLAQAPVSSLAADIAGAAGTCFSASFPREQGPIKEVTAIYTQQEGARADASGGGGIEIQFTEWDVPNQVFSAGAACQRLGLTARCQVDCDGGHAAIALSEGGQLLLETARMRTDVSGDRTLLRTDEDADGGELTGLFSLAPKGKDAACRPQMVETFVSLQAGDIASRVKDVEQRLNTLGLLLELPDEVFDETTRKAVVQFQQQYRLPATGIVDERTSRSLSALVRRGAGGC